MTDLSGKSTVPGRNAAIYARKHNIEIPCNVLIDALNLELPKNHREIKSRIITLTGLHNCKNALEIPEHYLDTATNDFLIKCAEASYKRDLYN